MNAPPSLSLPGTGQREGRTFRAANEQIKKRMLCTISKILFFLPHWSTLMSFIDETLIFAIHSFPFPNGSVFG